MMRRFSSTKKFATFALAAAMAASVIAPIDAQAASGYVKSLSTSKTSVSVKAGKTVSVTATVKVSGSASKKVSASSKNKKVATVSVKNASNGKNTVKIKGVKKGNTTVTVKTSGKNKSKKQISKSIKVKVNYADAKTITITADKTSIKVGAHAQLTAKVTPAKAKQKVTWTSSNKAVADVNSKGLVTGYSDGEAVITAKSSGSKTATIKITVGSVSVTGVKITNKDGKELDKYSMNPGLSLVLTADVTPKNATDRTYSWVSSNTSVATINSEGVVKALAVGTTDLTVTTSDGGFKATLKLTVTEDSKTDVNNLEAKVTNAIDGFPNTVLVGETSMAKVSVTATKDGLPYTDDAVVSIDRDISTGFQDLYELTTNTLDFDASGIATFYVKMRDGVTKPAVIDNWANDRGYANLAVKIVAGGANLDTQINVSFAQIDGETENSLTRFEGLRGITVENDYLPPRYTTVYEEELNPLVAANSGATSGITTNKNGKLQEYIIEQQQSNATLPNGNHRVAFDAAPLLIIADEIGENSQNDYKATVADGSIKEYSVYAGDDKYVELKDVPGGLEYLALTFKTLQLSQYSQIVVQAYQHNTEIPIAGAVQIIGPDRVIEAGSVAGNKVSINKAVFDVTANMKYVDIRLYVQSFGQVCEDTNIGFELISAEGPYDQTLAALPEIKRITSAVEWKVGAGLGYNAWEDLTAAQARINVGNFYNANASYRMTMPTYPETGNAIVEQKLDNEITYYMIPTTNGLKADGTPDNINVLVDNPGQNVFKVTTEQVQELVLTASEYKIGEDKRLYINTEKVGYVEVEAAINAYDKAQYKVNSAVTFAPIPALQTITSSDYYALTGQDVILEATVKSKSGSLASEVPVTFVSNDRNDRHGQGNVPFTQTVNTGSDGKAKYTITGIVNADVLKRLAVNAGNAYDVTWTIGGQAVTTDEANIHWVTPGIRYQAAADQRVYITSDAEWYGADATANVQVAVPSQYVADSNWIVGTTVAGTIAANDTNGAVADISNMKIKYTSSGLTIVPEEVKNGVVKITTKQMGNYDLIAGFDGFIDATKDTVITLANGDTYVNVGTGTPSYGKPLDIQVRWIPGEAVLTIVNKDMTYDINHRYITTNGNQIENYLKVADKDGNPIAGLTLECKITNKAGNIVAQSNTLRTDANGLVPVRFAVPNEATVYTISANITGSSKIQSTTVTFVANAAADADFRMQDAAPDNDLKQVVVTFTQPVDEKAADMAFYTVVDATGKNYVITAASVNPGNANQIILTINMEGAAPMGADTVVTVTDRYTTPDGITHLLLDSKGNILTLQ